MLGCLFSDEIIACRRCPRLIEHCAEVARTKRLAYRVSKHREGIFIYLSLRSTDGEMVKELERRLKVAEPVIKYQTIRLDEEMKLQKKLVARREKKMARKPRRQAAPPTAAAAPAGDQASATPAS